MSERPHRTPQPRNALVCRSTRSAKETTQRQFLEGNDDKCPPPTPAQPAFDDDDDDKELGAAF